MIFFKIFSIQVKKYVIMQKPIKSKNTIDYLIKRKFHSSHKTGISTWYS